MYAIANWIGFGMISKRKEDKKGRKWLIYSQF